MAEVKRISRFEAPWETALPLRLRALARGRTRVAYFYEQPDDSTFRYRVYNMTQALDDGSNEVSASYFFLADLSRLPEIAELADLLVICRARYDHRVNRLVNAFHRLGKRVLFDVDDLVFDVRYGHLVQHTLEQDLDDPRVWDNWFAYSSRIGETLRLCDQAVTTNDYLADRVRDFADIPVGVVSNFMNREQLAVSGPIYAARRAKPPGEGAAMSLGYFSGSPSHNRDFAMVEPALEAALEENPRLHVVVAGYIEPGPLLKRFRDRVVQHPFCDFVTLQELVGSVDISLVPLQSNAFTHCKSELKYFEAAVVGTQTIASPTYTYARAITHGKNGYLARAHEWQSVIRTATRDAEGLEDMARLSHDLALEAYSWCNQRDGIIDALGLT
jgi:glycosyltransferase involved in cell wall biosynthesis